MIIDEAAQTMTVKNLYNFYLNRPDKALVVGNDAGKLKLPKGTYLNLELFINEGQVNIFSDILKHRLAF